MYTTNKALSHTFYLSYTEFICCIQDLFVVYIHWLSANWRMYLLYRGIVRIYKQQRKHWVMNSICCIQNLFVIYTHWLSADSALAVMNVHLRTTKHSFTCRSEFLHCISSSALAYGKFYYWESLRDFFCYVHTMTQCWLLWMSTCAQPSTAPNADQKFSKEESAVHTMTIVLIFENFYLGTAEHCSKYRSEILKHRMHYTISITSIVQTFENMYLRTTKQIRNSQK